MRIEANSLIELLAKGPAESGLATLEMCREMWLKSTLPLPLAEMLRLRVAQLAKCEYALHIRFEEPVEAGLTEAMLAQIHEPERSDLPESWKLALQFAELLLTNPEAISDAYYAEMLLHFPEAQLVEMTYFITHNNVMHRFCVAMQVPPPNGDKIEWRRLGLPVTKAAQQAASKSRSAQA